MFSVRVAAPPATAQGSSRHSIHPSRGLVRKTVGENSWSCRQLHSSATGPSSACTVAHTKAGTGAEIRVATPSAWAWMASTWRPGVTVSCCSWNSGTAGANRSGPVTWRMPSTQTRKLPAAWTRRRRCVAVVAKLARNAAWTSARPGCPAARSPRPRSRRRRGDGAWQPAGRRFPATPLRFDVGLASEHRGVVKPGLSRGHLIAPRGDPRSKKRCMHRYRSRSGRR